MRTKILALLAITTLILAVGCGTKEKKSESNSSKAEEKTDATVDESRESLANTDSDIELYLIAEYDSDGNTNFTMSEVPGKFELTTNIDDLLNNGSVIATGADIAKAEAMVQTNSATGSDDYIVDILFTKKGTEAFAEATTAAVANEDAIAIYYNGEILSCPKVLYAITDGHCVIQGLESYEEAEALANNLNK